MSRAAARPMRFVALLRGINVGKAKRIAMADLRALLEAQGFGDVKTLLNSGNAVFTAAGGESPAHAATIAACLETEIGIPVHVIVRSASEFASAVAGVPAAPAEAEHSRYLVAFAQDGGALQGLAEFRPLLQPAERLEIGGHAAYLHCADGILESRVATAMLGKAGRAVTTRNWATVLKIQALLA